MGQAYEQSVRRDRLQTALIILDHTLLFTSELMACYLSCLDDCLDCDSMKGFHPNLLKFNSMIPFSTSKSVPNLGVALFKVGLHHLYI